MRLKYRLRIIFIIILSMFFGLLIFSIDSGDGDRGKNRKRVLTDKEIESALTAELKKNAYDEVNDLINDYLDAKLKGDSEAIKKYISDTSTDNNSDINSSSKYLEQYLVVDCYTIDLPLDETYVVYVYKEYKMKGIDTGIPSIVRHYVCPDAGGKLVIYSGEVDASVNRFIENTRKNPAVDELINGVDNKIEQIKQDDDVARAFLDKLDEVTESEKNKESESPSDKGDTTAKPTSSDSSSKPSATVESSSTPAPSATDESSSTPAPSAAVESSSTPKPLASAKASSTPKPSASTKASSTPKPSASVKSSSTPKPSAKAS